MFTNDKGVQGLIEEIEHLLKKMKEETMIKHMSQISLTIITKSSTINYFKCLDKWNRGGITDSESNGNVVDVTISNYFGFIFLLFILARGSSIQVYLNTCVIIPNVLPPCPLLNFSWPLIFLIIKPFQSLIQKMC